MKIVCYGDSNTYGYKPYHDRYDRPYPLILNELLDNKYEVYNEGLNGRTSIYNCLDKERIGISNIDETLLKYNHIDYFIFMLGTNDLKIGNASNIDDIFNGLDILLDRIYKLNIIDHFIFVSPILLGKNIGDDDIEFNYHSYELSLSFYDVYKKLANKYKPDYLIDAKELINPTFDHAHFPLEGHKVLAEALSNIIR